jgi:hypothetical protein
MRSPAMLLRRSMSQPTITGTALLFPQSEPNGSSFFTNS